MCDRCDWGGRNWGGVEQVPGTSRLRWVNRGGVGGGGQKWRDWSSGEED